VHRTWKRQPLQSSEEEEEEDAFGWYVCIIAVTVSVYANI